MNTPIVAVDVADDDLQTWRDRFHADFAHADIVPLNTLKRGDRADAAVVWQAPRGVLGSLAGLRFVLARGAGVDHLLDPEVVPPSATLLRMRVPVLAEKMAEFVVLAVLYLHRDWLSLRSRQTDMAFAGELPSLVASHRRVGILGLGELGRVAAERLKPFGFPLLGWSRHRRAIAGVETFGGTDGLHALAERADILVNLLPLTPETADLLDARLFARLPKGAAIVNAGRGGSLVEVDLLHALDDGWLSGAVIDVTRAEPLPPDHPFWRHARIVLTQHSAAGLTPEEDAGAAARILRKAFAGEALPERVERERGY